MDINLYNGDCLEIMRQIPDKRKFDVVNKEEFLSLYEVTREGKIISKKNGHMYAFTKDAKGYYRVRLPYPNTISSDGRRPFKVHRIVAMCFLEDYSESLQVNHKNGDKTDNNVNNLEMVTSKENTVHAWSNFDYSLRREKLEKRRRKNGQFGKYKK